ncbi:hypothetical protein ABZ318_14700 [Streptomyces sp. NPDC006197]
MPRWVVVSLVATGARAYGGGVPRCVVFDAEFESTEPVAAATR